MLRNENSHAQNRAQPRNADSAPSPEKGTTKLNEPRRDAKRASDILGEQHWAKQSASPVHVNVLLVLCTYLVVSHTYCCKPVPLTHARFLLQQMVSQAVAVPLGEVGLQVSADERVAL